MYMKPKERGKHMFRIGDAVIHPAEGVCEITEITEKNFSGTAAEYYVLKSVYDGQATVYIPVEAVKTRAKIRLALSREQVQKIIDSLEKNEPVKTDNDNQRRMVFKEMLASGNESEIGRVLTTVHNLKKEIQKSGRKMKVSDERIIKETERSVFGEFAFSLGISPEEIPAYIDDRING